MGFYIGLDIGGTKIAGAVFDEAGKELAQAIRPTPDNYSALVTDCAALIAGLDAQTMAKPSVGAGIPYGVANMPYFSGKPFEKDLGALIGRPLRAANDANCAALAESIDGAGQGYSSIFGLIIGTGVGGGFVSHGRVVEGANGLMGEVGHVPLPYYVESDGPLQPCNCGQKGCIEKLVSGGGLARLYESMTGQKMDAAHIADAARAGDKTALRVLDQYYTVLAKAMVTIIHTFDPEIIVVSGGMNTLPGMYKEVPKRWGKYALVKEPKTKFVPAKHGAMAGLRGAAWLWK